MWALDLGTTNSLIARWDESTGRPQLLELPSLQRRPTRPDPAGPPRAVPSAVQLVEAPGFWAELGRSGFLARHLFLGTLAKIGQPALDANAACPRASFVPTFKRALSASGLMTVARVGKRRCSAREVAWHFLRELLAAVKAQTGERLRELVVTSPIEAFESYRAEVAAIGRSLGLRRVRFLDEPLAAALGYGLGIQRERRVLVVDFGGGTLHVALVALGAASARQGAAEVLAKAGRDVGGNVVDRWLLEEVCQRLGYALLDEPGDEQQLWQRLMLAEACRVKEELFFEDAAIFDVVPPEELRVFEARLKGEAGPLEVRRSDLVEVLNRRGLYALLESCITAVLAEAKQKTGSDAVDDVLMVGGSTLLPEIFSRVEARFGRDRVRAWQPFEAVAYGACVFAADQVEPADFIVHDYALRTFDKRTGAQEHTVIVPRGTRFPTAPDLWKRQLVPTCALGEPERQFKLVVCELGGTGTERTFGWDGGGRLHQLGAGQPAGPLVVPLNEASPTLGTLDPPHSPKDTRPRLEVSFGVNVERWLCATVLDLQRSKHLMRDTPVVRLL